MRSHARGAHRVSPYSLARTMQQRAARRRELAQQFHHFIETRADAAARHGHARAWMRTAGFSPALSAADFSSISELC